MCGCRGLARLNVCARSGSAGSRAPLAADCEGTVAPERVRDAVCIQAVLAAEIGQLQLAGFDGFDAFQLLGRIDTARNGGRA